MNQRPLPEPNTESLFENLSIDIDSLPHAEHIAFDPIERKYANILYLTTSIFFFVLLILMVTLLIPRLGLLYWVSWASLLLWVFLYLFSMWFAWASVRKKAYAIRDKDISYKTGVFFRQWITIPFNRVQHCEVSRGIFDRMFGLVELKIFTAGGSSSDISIPGLKPDVAHTLKELVINKVDSLDEEE